jgi:TctA family transporter
MGSLLGILPGGGATLGAFASYALEKRISATPERFGRGAIEGVAGPESANNAGAQTSFIPLLTLGLPSNAIMGLMVGAMMIQGIAPGPQVMTEKPALFWGMIASMWVGNLMLLILNLPLVGMWVKVLSIPYRWLFPGIILICAVGTYSLNLSIVELWVFFAFGIVGFVLTKLGCEPAPLILAFVLGPMMEENLRRALLLFKGNVGGFLNRPLSLTILALAVALLIVVVLPSARKTREEAFQE